MGEIFFSFLLHSHMPYVRRNGDWPCGEEWILEAWVESYLPIWDLIEDLSSGEIPAKLALTVTPVLAEQLQDHYLQERLVGYMENRMRQAREEVSRLKGMGDEPRVRLASWYHDRYDKWLEYFHSSLRGRMMEVLRQGIDSGRLEVLASAATHPHLPLLGNDVCRRAQIAVGLESYRRCFGRDPEGFWLPECAYTRDLDHVLSEFSPPLKYVILDHSAIDVAPEKACNWEPRRLGSTPLVALLRDELAHDILWSREGIPSHPHYREYSKRDHEGHGFQYWRITSLDTPLDEKETYNPKNALAQAGDDASAFAQALRRRREEAVSECAGRDTPGVILAAYDTELFGHWWLEGPAWLREVLRLAGRFTELPSQVASTAAAADPPPFSPRLTAWNAGGSFDNWINPSTRDIWNQVHGAEEDFLAHIHPQPDENPESRRAIEQAARELLLIEASDWTYMITRDQAAAYARDRFESHLKRYYSLMDMLRRRDFDLPAISALEETDKLFPWLNARHWKT